MIWTILTVSAVVSSLRLLPFVFAESLRKSRVANLLAIKLPACIIFLQIVYCLANRPFLVYPYGIPELAGIATVIALHVAFRNLLLSIVGGFTIFEVLFLTLSVEV
ncbi:MAG: AzlD domain-containing protein [Verrucomicrobia bacterium]|nr:AzlD domain-containing protein [Verrucomicrobiota bacterium]